MTIACLMFFGTEFHAAKISRKSASIEAKDRQFESLTCSAFAAQVVGRFSQTVAPELGASKSLAGSISAATIYVSQAITDKGLVRIEDLRCAEPMAAVCVFVV